MPSDGQDRGVVASALAVLDRLPLVIPIRGVRRADSDCTESNAAYGPES